MAKKDKSRKAQGGRSIWLWVAGVVAVALIAIVVATQGGAAASAVVAKLNPQQYVGEFTNPARPHLLVDVRTPEEFASGHIPGAVNISVDSLSSRLSEIPSDQPVVVYCRSGNRSATASRILADAGYTEIYDMGAIFDWQAAGLPIE